MLKTKHTWQKAVVSYRSQTLEGGVTKESLDMIMTQGKYLGPLSWVEIMMPYGASHPDTLTRFIDWNGRYIQVDGFSYGYAGEGPNGLVRALGILGLSITINTVSSWKAEHLILNIGDLGRSFSVEECQCHLKTDNIRMIR